MEIDTFSVITGIGFFVFIFGTLGFLVWKGKARTNKMKKALDEMSIFYRLHIEQREVWNDKALGLDTRSKSLIFIDHSNNEKKRQLIKLSGQITTNVLHLDDVIQLIIECKDKNAFSRGVLTLFNVAIDDPVESGYHLLLAKKWSNYIRELSANPTKRSKAA